MRPRGSSRARTSPFALCRAEAGAARTRTTVRQVRCDLLNPKHQHARQAKMKTMSMMMAQLWTLAPRCGSQKKMSRWKSIEAMPAERVGVWSAMLASTALMALRTAPLQQPSTSSCRPSRVGGRDESRRNSFRPCGLGSDKSARRKYCRCGGSRAITSRHFFPQPAF